MRGSQEETGIGSALIDVWSRHLLERIEFEAFRV